jgi:hypothetical protein
MRTAWGPNKTGTRLPPKPELSLGVVTHFTEHPYHANRLEVVKLCLDTLLDGSSGITRELIIWDNGSLPRFHDFLEGYHPTVFVKSPNIGIGNAQIAVSKIARGRLLCLTDDDVLFHPSWFYLQNLVLKTFPKVGVVSGSPQRTAFRWAIGSNLEWGRSNDCLTTGRLIPDEWENDFCISVGRDSAGHRRNTSAEQDFSLECNGVKAWAHGHHMQFLGRRDVIEQFIEARRSDTYLDDAHSFNIAIDQAGLLNLTTYDRTALHIGNLIDPSIERIRRDWAL